MLTKREKETISILHECFQRHFQEKKPSKDTLEIDNIYYINFDGALLFRNASYYSNISNPDFLGLSFIYGINNDTEFNIKLSNTPPEKIYFITPQKAISIVNENNLHSYIGLMLAARLNRLIQFNRFFHDYSSYEKIREIIYHIHSLEAKPDIPLAQIIISITGMSRSWVMNILSELRNGEYIKLNKGVLIKVTKNLPGAF